MFCKTNPYLLEPVVTGIRLNCLLGLISRSLPNAIYPIDAVPPANFFPADNNSREEGLIRGREGLYLKRRSSLTARVPAARVTFDRRDSPRSFQPTVRRRHLLSLVYLGRIATESSGMCSRPFNWSGASRERGGGNVDGETQ